MQRRNAVHVRHRGDHGQFVGTGCVSRSGPWTLWTVFPVRAPRCCW